jgi:uncharacterized protein
MRTSSAIFAALLVALLATGAQAGSASKFDSPQAAFEQGLVAYKAGSYDTAIPALEEAAAKAGESSRFFAEFYLARIYSDTSGMHTDHGKAYLLFQKLADENADVDPDEGHRAPFVAKALTALAGYLRTGVPELGVAPDMDRAIEYLQNAATSFGDHEAQFELAKIYLGRGGADDIKLAKHFLSVLVKDGFASAQAYLADLYWRGRYVKRDEQRALALISMAVENAPTHERIWIEDAYLSIFCGSSQTLRKQAEAVVTTWRQVFARSADADSRRPADSREAQPQRTCRSGEVVEIKRVPALPAAEQGGSLLTTRPTSGQAMQGSTTAGFGLREAGATK